MFMSGQECVRHLPSSLFKRNYMFSFTSINSSHYSVQCRSYACILRQIRGTSIQRFISFDEIGTLCKLRRLRNTRKASETGCRNEDSLLRVSAPGNAYVFFGSLISVIFASKRLPCRTRYRNILIFRIRVIGEWQAVFPFLFFSFSLCHTSFP